MKTSRSQHPHHATSASCSLDGNYLQFNFLYTCKATTPKITNNYPHYKCRNIYRKENTGSSKVLQARVKKLHFTSNREIPHPPVKA